MVLGLLPVEVSPLPTAGDPQGLPQLAASAAASVASVASAAGGASCSGPGSTTSMGAGPDICEFLRSKTGDPW